MGTFRDQLGRDVEIPASPRRIISLVPSQTELLADLGLEEKVIGITKFCVHPREWFGSKTRVGGTKKLHLDTIRSLQPDLIIANKEENDKDQLELLMQEYPVWVSDIQSLPEALQMITSVGAVTGKKAAAGELVKRIQMKFARMPPANRPGNCIRAAYFIWHNPWMAAGSHTFIDDMMRRCGLENHFAHVHRYPEISLSQLHAATGESRCQLALLSSEPFPFKEKHAEEIRGALPGVKILLVDGEMFSWYGSRLLRAPEYFSRLPFH